MKAQKKGVKSNGTVTMRDVALKAGVSQGTVSRVLNGTPTSISISSDTQQRVMQAVEELGYYPNLAARTLRTQRTHLIAIMIADISNPFYHSIVRTIQDIVRVKDYDVMIANTDHHYEDEKRFCAAVMRRAVDGVIMVPFHLSTEEIDQVIQRTGTSIVALGKHITHPEVDLVYADDQLATYQGVHWLIEQQAHQHIGFIGVPNSFPPGPRRLHGYEAALKDAGITPNHDYTFFGDFTAETGYQAMQKFLSLPTPPTAVFSCNDRIAIGAIAAAQDMGLRVPTDVAVMGFDNIPEATLIRPHLTTMAQHPVEMARQLAQALLERIEEKYTGTQRLFEVPCTLIKRDSA